MKHAHMIDILYTLSAFMGEMSGLPITYGIAVNWQSLYEEKSNRKRKKERQFCNSLSKANLKHHNGKQFSILTIFVFCCVLCVLCAKSFCSSKALCVCKWNKILVDVTSVKNLCFSHNKRENDNKKRIFLFRCCCC